jgi:2,4-dienoyl-CoA reductase-like NADH-dependent reductase (Old Yellow Enzyme family)
MTKSDIATTISDYATAAANAMRAGFDGVQLQAGHSYLISQFLNPATNLRTDDYGGSMQNRSRLLFDVLDAVTEYVDVRRIGSRLAPRGPNTERSFPTKTPLDQRLRRGTAEWLPFVPPAVDESPSRTFWSTPITPSGKRYLQILSTPF